MSFSRMARLLLVLSLSWLCAVSGARAQESPHDCVDVSSTSRLARGSAFRAALPRNLELRILPHEYSVGAGSETVSWRISVAAVGRKDDFMWLMSPPYRTAPHRIIGASYGYSSVESVRIRRELRFVLTGADYERAYKIVDETPAGPAKQARLGQFEQGTLDLEITGHAAHVEKSAGSEDVDVLDWITFKARACVPKAAK